MVLVLLRPFLVSEVVIFSFAQQAPEMMPAAGIAKIRMQ